MIPGRRHEAQDRVDVPLVFDGELLCEDRDLEDHLLAEGVVGDLEVPKKLGNDLLRVGDVAHRVEEVEPAPADGDVLVAKREDDRLLVLFDRLETVAPCGKMSHRVEAEVPHVGLLGKDEGSEERGGGVDDGRLGVEVDREVDRLKEDGVLGVVVLDVLVRLFRVCEDLVEDVVQHESEGRVLCVRKAVSSRHPG